MKMKGNASAKRTKDKKGFEPWLSKVEEDICKVLKEAEAIDNEENDFLGQVSVKGISDFLQKTITRIA